MAINELYAENTGQISPVVGGTAAVDTGWVSLAGFLRWTALVIVGAQAGVTVTAQQATDASGTGAKEWPVNGASSVAFTSGTDDNTCKVIDLDWPEYGYGRLTLTPAGSSSVAAVLLGVQNKS
ncbi:MAG TPA: hypothetical protein VMD08_11075 [Candidatus Baltobacteraceae bacterium]|nr:hypothetical protein [Candidatus Baltobacteraceae bacterium]